MNPSVKRLLGTVLLIATVGLATVLAARESGASNEQHRANVADHCGSASEYHG